MKLKSLFIFFILFLAMTYLYAYNTSPKKSNQFNHHQEPFSRIVDSIPDSNDLGVTKLVSPEIIFMMPATPQYLTVRIVNFGSKPQHNFPVSYSIGFNKITSSVSDTLNPGDSLDFQFSTQITPALGLFTICARTELNTDTNQSNNETCNDYLAAPDTTWGAIPETGIMEMNVYPNPLSDKTNIQINSQSVEKADLCILSSNGQIIQKKELDLNLGNNEIEVNLENQNPGLYFYTLEVKGQTFSGKLILH